MNIEKDNKPLLGSDYKIGSKRIRSLDASQENIKRLILKKDTELDYEKVECYCGAKQEDDIQLSQIDRYGLNCSNVICRGCGLIRINPRWKEERYEKFYKYEYRDLYNQIKTSKEDFAIDTMHSKRVQDLSKWVLISYSKYIKGKESCKTRIPTILEIGSGGGWNLASLPGTWRKIGYDLDSKFLEIGVNIFNIDMRYGLVEDAYDEISGADIILMIHVLEHFLDPVKILKQIASRINKNAIIIIEVPGIFNMHNSALNPMTYFQNAHTYTFTSATLKSICEKSGFEVLEVDEFCRVVCKKRYDVLTLNETNKEALRVLKYILNCELGFKLYLNMRRVPYFGRYIGLIFRIIYFNIIKIFY